MNKSVNKLFVFSSVVKQNMIFFSFFSGLLNGRKNSNFFKIAVEGSDSMKGNYGGFTFKRQNPLLLKLIIFKRRNSGHIF